MNRQPKWLTWLFWFCVIGSVPATSITWMMLGWNYAMAVGCLFVIVLGGIVLWMVEDAS